MAEVRSAEEIRRSIEANRAELGLAVERLRAEVTEVTDWRKQLSKHRKQVLIGAAVAGFVLGGGIAGLVGLVSGGGERLRPTRPAAPASSGGRGRMPRASARSPARLSAASRVRDVDHGDDEPGHDGGQRPAERAQPVGGRRGEHAHPDRAEARRTASRMSRPSIRRPRPICAADAARRGAGCGGPATGGRRAG